MYLADREITQEGSYLRFSCMADVTFLFKNDFHNERVKLMISLDHDHGNVAIYDSTVAHLNNHNPVYTTRFHMFRLSDVGTLFIAFPNDAAEGGIVWIRALHFSSSPS